MVAVQCVCLCVVCVDLHQELPQQCLYFFNGADTVYMCVFIQSCMTITTTGAEDWIGQDTLEDILKTTKKDMGGLDSMNNTLFTPYYVPSTAYLTYIMCAYTHSGSHSCQSSTLCNNLLYFWMNGVQACYANTTDMHIPQKYLTKKSILMPFVGKSMKLQTGKHNQH